MRIVHATTVHRWDDGRIFERQSRALARGGHEVFLLAPITPGRPVDGVHFVSLGEAERRTDRMWRLVNKVRRCVSDLDPDVVVLHDPELLRLVPALRRRRTAVVYDAHEDYAAQLRDKEWLPAPIRRAAAPLLGRLELAAAARTDLTLVATPTIAARFEATRPLVVLNRPIVEDLPSLEELSAARSARTGRAIHRLLFVGDLRAARGAHALVDAMNLVNDEQQARLTIVGRLTPERLRDELALSPGWQYVDIAGWQPRSDVNRALTEADVALLPFLDADNHRDSQPNKLFEYLHFGVPVVATDFELWRRLAEPVASRYEVARSGDPASIAGAVLSILDAPPDPPSQVSAAAAARDLYSWTHEEDQYLAAMEALDPRGRGTPA